MYRTPIYPVMKGIGLWEGIKFFPILNTAWKYAIVHALHPQIRCIYKLFV